MVLWDAGSGEDRGRRSLQSDIESTFRHSCSQAGLHYLAFAPQPSASFHEDIWDQGEKGPSSPLALMLSSWAGEEELMSFLYHNSRQKCCFWHPIYVLICGIDCKLSKAYTLFLVRQLHLEPIFPLPHPLDIIFLFEAFLICIQEEILTMINWTTSPVMFHKGGVSCPDFDRHE